MSTFCQNQTENEAPGLGLFILAAEHGGVCLCGLCPYCGNAPPTAVSSVAYMERGVRQEEMHAQYGRCGARAGLFHRPRGAWRERELELHIKNKHIGTGAVFVLEQNTCEGESLEGSEA